MHAETWLNESNKDYFEYFGSNKPNNRGGGVGIYA